MSLPTPRPVTSQPRRTAPAEHAGRMPFLRRSSELGDRVLGLLAVLFSLAALGAGLAQHLA